AGFNLPLVFLLKTTEPAGLILVSYVLENLISSDKVFRVVRSHALRLFVELVEAILQLLPPLGGHLRGVRHLGGDVAEESIRVSSSPNQVEGYGVVGHLEQINLFGGDIVFGLGRQSV